MQYCTDLPPLLRERLGWLYEPETLEQIYQSFSSETTPTFRVNTLKTSVKSIQQSLTDKGFVIVQVSWYHDAFYLQNRSIRELTTTPEYQDGFLYIQNLSSMIPALVMDPKPEEKILDLAAAPGSKTTQIAALMQNTGELTANDLSYKRLYKLKENLKQMGITNTKVLNLPGESFWKNLPEYFDKTLVDVPCSMEGRIKCTDPKTYQDWSTKKIKQLSKLQKYLLRSAVAATKITGTIVYSSCTLSPEENEEVIEWVISKSPGALQVDKIAINDIPFQQGLQTWKNKKFIHTKETARIVPSQTMEGFFIAKLTKVASTLPSDIH